MQNVLSYEYYNTLVTRDNQKISTLENEIGNLKDGMNKIFLLVQQNPTLANVKPEVLEKIVK